MMTFSFGLSDCITTKATSNFCIVYILWHTPFPTAFQSGNACAMLLKNLDGLDFESVFHDLILLTGVHQLYIQKFRT